MAFTIIQAGDTLQLVDTDGTLQTLTLPTGITLRTDVPPRWEIFQRFVILTNTPSRPLTIDAMGIVRVLSPTPPGVAPLLSGVAGGSLSGTFQVAYTFVIEDELGNTIAESDFSPRSAFATITTQDLRAAGIDVSTEDMTGRKLYRTTSNGSVLFPWTFLDGNTLTSIQDDLGDAGLSIVAAQTFGTAPRLTHIAQFRGRLFGIGDVDIDMLRYTEVGIMYSWPISNSIIVPNVGSDAFGVTALVARREALGVGRRNQLHQLTGTSNSDFRLIKLSENCGIESQETVRVYKDVGYFLWKDGVYQWNSEGIRCISDGSQGRGQVRSWFTTDDYFNRAEFEHAFAMIIPERSVYRLFLASAEQTTIDRFVDFDLNERTWWGPHKTDAFTPSSALIRPDIDDVLIPMIGASTGHLYQEQAIRTDHATIGVDFHVTTKRHAMDIPDLDKYFGQLSMLGVPQTAGKMTITASVGELNAVSDPSFFYDLTQARERLQRGGRGKHIQYVFREATAGQDVILTGYEFPYHVLGRR